MTDPTALVRNAVPSDDDRPRLVHAATGVAPSSLRGVVLSSSDISSSVAGATNCDPSSPDDDDDDVAGKTAVLLMANHKLHGTNVNKSR